MIQNVNMNSTNILAQETDIHLVSVSEAMCPSLFAQHLTDNIMVECRQDVEAREGCYAREVRTNQRHSSVIPEHISHVVGIGLKWPSRPLLSQQKGAYGMQYTH